jgi:N utilization substance protein A
MSKEILDAIGVVAYEKGIDPEILFTALEDALLAAYRKTSHAKPFARVEFDRETGDIRVFTLMLTPEELEGHPGVSYPEPEPPAEGEPLPLEPVEPEAVIDWAQFPDSQIESADVTTADDFGRIAAQTAKQVILQRMREAEREIMFEEYKDRVGDIVTGVVQQADSRATIVDLGRGVEALLPGSEQVPGERYEHGARIKGVIIEVRTGTRGPQIVLSRRSDELIRKLFEMEVPEIEGGHVEIRAVAREPGYRSKIAVVSHTDGVDPVGACVGPRGSRVRMVVSELRGEKIDIIPYNEEPARFVAKALSPARVREVLVDDEDKQATVIVPDDQLSLAIGRDGQNARLAARLTGWKVDIKSETEFSQEEQDIEYEGGEEADGRCVAMLSNGRRCPNASLPGSQHCGLPQHQALSRFGTNQVAVLSGLSDDEVTRLADPGVDQSAVADIVERAQAELEQAGVQEAEEAAEVEADEEPEAAEAEEPEAEEESEPEEAEEEPEPEEAEEESEPEEEPEREEEPVAEEAEAEEPEEEPEVEEAEEPDAESEPEAEEAEDEPQAAEAPEEAEAGA